MIWNVKYNRLVYTPTPAAVVTWQGQVAIGIKVIIKVIVFITYFLKLLSSLFPLMV